MDTIREFYIKYEVFVKKVTTGNKRKFESIETIQSVNEVLELLIKAKEFNLIEKIDNYMIYNVLLITKIFIHKLKEPSNFTSKKIPIINLKNNLNRLEKLNIKEEKYKSRH